MLSAFDSMDTYHSGEFKCIKCVHETVIFVNTKYSMFGLMESDIICCICNKRKAIVSDGDLILRYDWPDADDNPWQLQCAEMRANEKYCKQCSSKTPKDWKKFIVPCSKCDGYMAFNK